MLQITPQMRVLVSVGPADFRKGIDGLAKECRTALKSDPFSGAVFVFRNRRKTAVKLLVYDGQGFWLCTKRLSAGKFKYWPSSNEESSASLQTYAPPVRNQNRYANKRRVYERLPPVFACA